MDSGEPVQKKRSPWFYVGVGCMTLVVLGTIGFVASIYFVARGVSNVARDSIDPQKRNEKAKSMLGGLPAGYTATMAVSVPFLMDMVHLSNLPPLPDGGISLQPGGRAFMFLSALDQAETRQQLNDFFSGKTSDLKALGGSGFKMNAKQVIGRGEVKGREPSVPYVSIRGISRSPSGEGDVDAGEPTTVGTLFHFDCGKPDGRSRFGVWWELDGTPDAGTEELPKGSVVDPETFAEFLGPVQPCSSAVK